MLTMIREYWYIMFIIAGGCLAIGYNINKFVKLPTKSKVKKIIKWLVWACSEAEKKYGSNTGKLKLQEVWAMFIDEFPKIADAIEYSKFETWVDEALVEMKKLMNDNDTIKDIINPSMETNLLINESVEVTPDE